MTVISTMRLFRTLLYSRLNQRNKDRVRQAWSRNSYRFPWGLWRRLAQKHAIAEVRKDGACYRSSISFQTKMGQFESETDSNGHRRLKIPLIVDFEFGWKRRPDPIAFAEDEPGHWGKLLDGENARIKVDYPFMVRYLTNHFVRNLWRSLPHEEFRALRIANRDETQIATSCLLIAAQN